MNQPATTRGRNDLPINLPHNGPARVGQGTAVEQSRATSEVYFRVMLAHEQPRDEDLCRAAMAAACSRLRLAEKAFYTLPRSGGSVEGASVHLARELARIWGNLDYGVKELRQDDTYGQSEIEAFAWDLQTNARSAATFIVPHKKDAGGRVKKLDTMQGIYENNANNGAKRVREAIFNVLPHDFVEEAKELCKVTIAKGDGTPLAERIATAIGLFDKDFGITQAQLEAKLNREADRWDTQDVASLSVTYRSLRAREVTKDEAFPPAAAPVSGAELIGTPAASPPAASPPAADPPPPAGEPVDRSDEQVALEEQEGNA